MWLDIHTLYFLRYCLSISRAILPFLPMPTTRLLKALSKSLAYFSCWYLSCGGKIRRNLPQFLSSNSVLAFSLRIFVSKSFYKIHKIWRWIAIFFIIVTRFTAPSPPSYQHTWKDWNVIFLRFMSGVDNEKVIQKIQFFIWLH